MGNFPIKIRGHHLLCMLTYIGKGYTPAFVQQFDAVVAAINKGDAIEIIDGPDAICMALQQEDACLHDHAEHCHTARVAERDKKALQQIDQLLEPEVAFMRDARTQITKGLVQNLRANFTSGTIRAACKGCEWFELCSAVSAADYKGTKLAPVD